MMKSMTAYASVEKSENQGGSGISVSVEIRSYNSRHLDAALRLPAGFIGLEEKIKKMINTRLVRGRVEMRLTYNDTSDTAIHYELDQHRLRSYMACVDQLKSVANINLPLSIDFLAGVSGLITPTDIGPSVQQHWSLIAGCIDEALDQVDRMRSEEGAFISRDIEGRLDVIEKHTLTIEKASQNLPALYREKLQMRIESLTDGVVTLDPVRIAQEAAILADRSDISEEITRVRSHINQFRSIMADKEAAGRRLNFLLQELNREFNTMGSKTGQAEVAHVIVDIKAELEKMREQVQNIE